MKVFVCGASGLVGRDLGKCLSENKIEWIGSYFSRPCANSSYVNFLEIDKLREHFRKTNPTHCVNCIAERAVDVCEQKWQLTKQNNIDIVRNLATVCKEQNIHFVHISTDYVFDGETPPFTPESRPNPLQSYGISKLIAELRVQLLLPSATIIRVPVLYTDSYHNFTETAVTLIGKKVLDFTTTHKEDDYCIRRPVFIPDLCQYILKCLSSMPRGVQHFYNANDRETKYTIATLIGKYLAKSTDHIQGVKEALSSNAGRPYDTQLFTEEQRNTYSWTTPLPIGIQKCFEKLYHPPVIRTQPPAQGVFWMLDLDGTILDTDQIHLDCYNEVLSEQNIPKLLTDVDTIEKDLLELFDKEEFLNIRQEKNKRLCSIEKPISFLPGAKELLQYFLDYNVNFAIVTNTSNENVDFFKSKLPLLNQCTQWITREDVQNPKPSPEPYMIAKANFWKQEPFCVGIENSVNGYMSLKYVTNCIYIVCSNTSKAHTALAKEDVYFIQSLSDIYTKVPMYRA